MVTKPEKIFFAAIILIIIALPFFWRDIAALFGGAEKTTLAAAHSKKEKKKKVADANDAGGGGGPVSQSNGLSILQRWELPAELTEISALAYVGPNRFACVQDEEGSLFFFNTGTGKVEQKVPFAGPGDYEGLAIAGNTAYVLRSDGVIFGIADYTGKKPSVAEYKTGLTAENDCEGLAWDKERNRLLVTVKKSGEKNQMPVYGFDLASKKMEAKPVLTIAFDNGLFAESGKKKDRGIRPSEINIHPTTGEIYVLEGTNPKLLVMDKDAQPKQLLQLDKELFPQPEGLTFSPSGDLFLSNEGGKGRGTILEVKTQ